MSKFLFVLLIFGFAQAQRTGSEVFQNLCAVCHQANGQGYLIEGGLLGERFHSTRETGLGLNAGFPPLAGNIENIFEGGGRDYLISVLLFGLEGEIEVNKQLYNGIMPAWGNLEDAELANVLNYVLTNWSGEEVAKNLVGAEFAWARAQAKLPQDNCQTRESLGFGCKINNP